jgi:hypothetical protein
MADRYSIARSEVTRITPGVCLMVELFLQGALIHTEDVVVTRSDCHLPVKLIVADRVVVTFQGIIVFEKNWPETTRIDNGLYLILPEFDKFFKKLFAPSQKGYR